MLNKLLKVAKSNPYYNQEKYPDPTAYHGIKNATYEERQVSDLIHIFKVICSLSGFEIVGRVHFRHKKSGREFKWTH